MGRTLRTERRLLRKDGTLLPVEISGKIIRDGVMQSTYDLRGNFLETNSKLCEMLGYTREELLRLNVEDLIPPEELAGAPIRLD